MTNYNTEPNKSKHYTYIILDMKKDMVYIGVRTSNCPINEDKYMGSSTHKDMIEGLKSRPDDFVKFVIMTFDTRDEAHQHEIDLHNEYDVGKNPRFYNKVKSTSTGFNTAGIKLSQDHKDKIGAAQKGKPGMKPTQETRDKMSAAGKGKNQGPQKKATCPHCGKLGGISAMKHYHFDNCPTYTGKACKKLSQDKISVGKKGIKIGPQKKATCPHCGKSGGISAMKRLHFDNCPTYTGKAHKKRSQETRDKISAAQKDKRQKSVTCPHCNKSGGIRAMKRYHFDNCPTYTGKERKKLSQETRDKMSAARKGKPRNKHTQETKDKISTTLKGKKLTHGK
jgi:hypothetical protein